MCDRTTIGLISSRLTGPLVCVFCNGTSLPILRYSGISALLSALVISNITLLLSCSLFLSALPSKQSGPSPLLKLLCLAASATSYVLNNGTSSILSFISSSTLNSISWDLTFRCSGILYIPAKYSAMAYSTRVLSSITSNSPVSFSFCTLFTTGWFLLILRTLLATW